MKKLILGLTIGMIIGSVTTAVAATQGEVTAVFANFIFKINGQEKKVDTTPLVYDGTSYLPVRAMADLLGYEVKYTTESRTIALNQPVTKSEPVDTSKWVALGELTLVPGIKVTISPGTSQINLEYGKQNFVFNLPNNAEDEKMAISNPGNINMLIKDGTTYLNRVDLERVGLPH
ncbi:Copper amine oxidase N-terminal domain-containing protein [Paenibacillus sp. 1_12]|uniref:stalk domain-containing protein n=1 Tax=Paenibacillus sp. 1_12 TaxID=1566278 RepID=UPI0008EF8B66|nr:stalk domain-containing protein [Paenibacillus sp. 1_12]SFL53904.1 Copper amine oxidase N-terminal domain-containing protein [Paenibacillus sp. 1_12]